MNQKQLTPSKRSPYKNATRYKSLLNRLLHSQYHFNPALIKNHQVNFENFRK